MLTLMMKERKKGLKKVKRHLIVGNHLVMSLKTRYENQRRNKLVSGVPKQSRKESRWCSLLLEQHIILIVSFAKFVRIQLKKDLFGRREFRSVILVLRMLWQAKYLIQKWLLTRSHWISILHKIVCGVKMLSKKDLSV